MFRFVHLADVHLDTPFRSRSESLRARLTEAGRQAFRAAVDLCLDEESHALLIAGDLFDNDRLSFATEGFLTAELRRLTDAGRTVVIVTGNHDPGRVSGANRAHAIDWPAERCHLLRSHTPAEIVVTDAEGAPVGRVVGAGHQTAHDTLNLAARYPTPTGAEPAVGVLHPQVQGRAGAENHDPYAPCTPEDLAALPYAYWALGHVHARERVLDRPAAWYCGNLQGRHFGETGAKGALLVTVRSGEPAEVEFRPLAPVRWEVLEIEGLETVENLADLRAAAAQAFDALREGPEVLDEQEWMLRVILRGPCPLAAMLREEAELAAVGEQLASLPGVLHAEVRAVGLTAPIDVDVHRGQPHVLGVALELLDAMAADDDLMDRLAPTPLAGHESEDPAARRTYLADLLSGLDRQAAEALLEEGAL